MKALTLFTLSIVIMTCSSDAPLPKRTVVDLIESNYTCIAHHMRYIHEHPDDTDLLDLSYFKVREDTKNNPIYDNARRYAADWERLLLYGKLVRRDEQNGGKLIKNNEKDKNVTTKCGYLYKEGKGIIHFVHVITTKPISQEIPASKKAVEASTEDVIFLLSRSFFGSIHYKLSKKSKCKLYFTEEEISENMICVTYETYLKAVKLKYPKRG